MTDEQTEHETLTTYVETTLSRSWILMYWDYWPDDLREHFRQQGISPEPKP